MTSVSAFTKVAAEVAAIVGALDERQWSAPTPCAEWDVRAVVDHLHDLQRNFLVTMTGEAKPEPDLTALIAAFEQEGALQRTVTTRLGQIPGQTALNIITMEHLAHGWDLAHAVGRTPSFDPDVAEESIAFAEMMRPSMPAHLVRFHDPQPISPEAPAIDRLAALLGRTID
jgi:uncharacterized protein (TIGR03083 family)